MSSLCGIDCAGCGLSDECKGCAETGGRPFGSECVVATYCQEGVDALCQFKEKLMEEFNALNLEGMGEVTKLYALKGSFVNLEYSLASGQSVKFWDDNKIYLGNQIEKEGSDRCYGLAADEKYLMVCEYGENGADAEIVVYKRRD